ncbi:hypothetical protein B0H11DRAFT_2031394 [Mycena galericulata]|nr:hypothetical protein B0H11DRAFT_2031394 [Mycena galericulata]
MNLSTSLILIFGLCGRVLGLGVQNLGYAFSEDPMAQGSPAEGVEAKLTNLWRRAPRLDNRLTTITIVVGVIGGTAMLAALFLALLLVLRRQRDRRSAKQSSDTAKTMVRFPSENKGAPLPTAFSPPYKERPYHPYQNVPFQSPPQAEPRRLDNLESAWFLDNADALGKNIPPRRAKTPPVTSRQNMDGEQNATTYGDPTSKTTSSRGRRSEFDSTSGGPTTKPVTRILPSLPQPTYVYEPEVERPPSPILFRQPEQPSITVKPRPRGSSLTRGSRPPPIIPPAANRHVTSVSEDIRPEAVSRFSISPIARSFSHRLNSPPGSNTNRASRRHTRFRSLSTLVHLKSESAAPGLPTDVR